MKVVKWKDFLERVAWTFIQAYVALGAIDWIAKGINLSLLHQLYVSLGAAVAATLKVLFAQNFGKHPDGAAIPGGVTKPGVVTYSVPTTSSAAGNANVTVVAKKPAAKRKTSRSTAKKKTASSRKR